MLVGLKAAVVAVAIIAEIGPALGIEGPVAGIAAIIGIITDRPYNASRDRPRRKAEDNSGRITTIKGPYLSALAADVGAVHRGGDAPVGCAVIKDAGGDVDGGLGD